MKYIKQLDSLRAIAVILVIISHWLPDSSINKIPNGEIGVDIFFVLSGFLISKILFENRNKAESTQTPKQDVIKNFYIRRTLRIFPIYYLVIFLLLLLSGETGTNIKGAFVYFFCYASNIYFFKIKTWDGMLSHLWSLAVEEQFYLIWPLITLFLPRKYLLHAIWIFVLTGLFSQYWMIGTKMGNILTFTCFDAFGLGALLAWQVVFHPKKLQSFYRITSWFGLFSLIIFSCIIIFNWWSYMPVRILISVISLWLISYIVLNSKENTIRLKFIWNNRVLIFLGKISYGIYLYHNIVPHLLTQKIINVYINPLLPAFLTAHVMKLYLVENTMLLVLVSWLSYEFIEKRFLNLKKYFTYQNKNSIKNAVVQLAS